MVDILGSKNRQVAVSHHCGWYIQNLPGRLLAQRHGHGLGNQVIMKMFEEKGGLCQ